MEALNISQNRLVCYLNELDNQQLDTVNLKTILQHPQQKLYLNPTAVEENKQSGHDFSEDDDQAFMIGSQVFDFKKSDLEKMHFDDKDVA